MGLLWRGLLGSCQRILAKSLKLRAPLDPPPSWSGSLPFCLRKGGQKGLLQWRDFMEERAGLSGQSQQGSHSRSTGPGRSFKAISLSSAPRGGAQSAALHLWTEALTAPPPCLVPGPESGSGREHASQQMRRCAHGEQRLSSQSQSVAPGTLNSALFPLRVAGAGQTSMGRNLPSHKGQRMLAPSPGSR